MLSRRSVPRRLTLVLAVFGLLALLPRDARAQVYRWVDNKGVVHYTQSVDNVPERYRDPRLSPSERTEVLEAVKALKDLEAMVTPEMKSFEYQWRLRKLEEVVTKSLRAMKRGRVATALSGALGHYRLAGELIERGVAASRARRAGCGAPGRVALRGRADRGRRGPPGPGPRAVGEAGPAGAEAEALARRARQGEPQDVAGLGPRRPRRAKSRDRSRSTRG
jgi:hypothetical protein